MITKFNLEDLLNLTNGLVKILGPEAVQQLRQKSKTIATDDDRILFKTLVALKSGASKEMLELYLDAHIASV